MIVFQTCLVNLGGRLLKDRRTDSRLCLFYKIVHDLVAVPLPPYAVHTHSFQCILNDIFSFIDQGVIYNYADDNTLSFIHANTDVLKKVLDEESCNLIDCFFIY